MESSFWQFKFAQITESGPDDYMGVIADTDRYTSDRYEVVLSLRPTFQGSSVSFHINNAQMGITGYAEYWHFKKNELSLARSVLAQLKKVIPETVEKIEYERIPMALISPMFREAISSIHPEHKEKSGVSLNNTYITDVPKKGDWRETIYGNKYPTRLLDNIQSTINHPDDPKKEVEAVGNSRQKTYRYKYAASEGYTYDFKSAGMKDIIRNLAIPAAAMGLSVNPATNAAPPMKTPTTQATQTTDSADAFHAALKATLKNEGGYVNDPKDHGGETNHGITQGTYSTWLNSHGKPLSSVKNITKNEVNQIYKEMYWDTIGGNRLPESVAKQMFDFAVNSGPQQATKHLQQIVGSKPDGVFGKQTEAAVKAYVAKRGESALANALLDKRKTFIENALQQGRIDQKYAKGLLNRIEHMRRLIPSATTQKSMPGKVGPAIPYNFVPPFESRQTTLFTKHDQQPQ